MLIGRDQRADIHQHGEHLRIARKIFNGGRFDRDGVTFVEYREFESAFFK